MTNFTDNSFFYVLICSTFPTIVGLASTWIVTAHRRVRPRVQARALDQFQSSEAAFSVSLR